ncbi:DNA cytosine methyltransferase [Oleispirillum naphthae]|uniref:DNA cytosine methyltransferase n=1 Tax=Oleispirillum naphthae TaxID=2838853 RepID=UPI003082450B
MAYKLIDLFAGAGGLSLGFTDRRFGGGFRSVLAMDLDPAAVKTYCANFGDHGVCADIEEWLASDRPIPKADVVIGGPPCQGFSLLNKRRQGDARRQLWQPYMDFVERAEAQAFVIENVAELRSSPEYEEIVRRAKDMGFEVVSGVLLAADYGAPQTRRRAVIIGYRADARSVPQFPPSQTHAAPQLGSKLPSWRTVREAIADLPVPIGTEIRDLPGPLDLHFGRTPTAVSLRRYRAVPPGGNRFDLQRNAPEITPPCWIKKTSGGTDLFGRLWWDRPSVTIRTEFFKPEKGRYLHPEQHRPITHREAARLMGFPDDFEFVGSKVEVARQIGNAVPPPLAGAVALTVKAFLDATKKRHAA